MSFPLLPDRMEIYMNTMCESCLNYEFDEEYGDYYCIVNMDEDDYGKIGYFAQKGCPYYHPGDEYTIVRKQN